MAMTEHARGEAAPVQVVADVGNSRIKLAVVTATDRGLPRIEQRHDLESHSFACDELEGWLMTAAPADVMVSIASVYDAAAARLEAAVAGVSATRHRPVHQRRVRFADLPIVVDLAEPERVGIDRLAAAAAACQLKVASRGCVVIDCGTAASVDVVSADGRFLGGAILPGPALMARSLADGTSLLPEVAALGEAATPAMPGRATNEAIAAGIGFGIRGGVARLVAEARRSVGEDAEVFLTGGWRAAVHGELVGAVELPDLVLAGIALAAVRPAAG